MNQTLKRKTSAAVFAAAMLSVSSAAFAAGECKPVGAQSPAVYRCARVTVTAKRQVPEVMAARPDACVPVAGQAGMFRRPAMVVTARRSSAAASVVAANEQPRADYSNLIAVSMQSSR